MKKSHGFSFVLFASALVFSIVASTACSTQEVAFQTATVKLSVSQLTLQKGESQWVTALVSPKSAAKLEAHWVSSDTSVADVKDGLVFAIGEGEATIRVFVGGGTASCKVTVLGDGGGELLPSLRFSTSSVTLALNSEQELSCYVYPSDATITYRSDNENIATVVGNGKKCTITGKSAGTTTVIASGSNGLTATCFVTVSDKQDPDDGTGGGGGGSGTTYSGKIIVGVPLTQQEDVLKLLNDPAKGFNATYPGSDVTFETVPWEEDKSADNMANPASGPDVYSYASDQTIRLYALNALAVLPLANSEWIKTKMGQEAYNYATLQGVNEVVGYPYAADNGYVMFYDKSLVSDPSQIDTVEKLFAKAAETGCEVDYALTNSFYAAGMLMTYAKGQSLYTLTAKQGGSYSAKGTFSKGDTGLKGAKLMKSIMNMDGYMGAEGIPGAEREILATISDCSKIKAYKNALKENYAAAPLPKLSDEDSTRLGVYLGYKFYGVNPAKAGGSAHQKVSHAVAKFLVDKYAQTERYNLYSTKPTLLELEGVVGANEPHILALNQQIADNGAVPLTAVDTALWSQCENAAKSIQKLPDDATDADYMKILEAMDAQLYKK